MRVLILKDKKITAKQLIDLKTDFSSLITANTGIIPVYYESEIDYTGVPVQTDSDGDLKPTEAYLRSLTDDVYAKYGDYGVDSVVCLVHQDNWIFTGIWGTNWSNKYRKYHVHLCRFDKKNKVNSLGTLYHEWMHCTDALIKTHTGFDINTLFKNTECYVDWDATVVHGNRFHLCKSSPFTYIRNNENLTALQAIAPHLQKAYAVRKELYLFPLRNALLIGITQLRAILNRKNGVPRV